MIHVSNIATTQINITPSGITVTQTDTESGVVTKEITLEDLQSIFEKSTIETPLLPLSTIYYNRKSGDSWSIACMVPPQIRNINVANRYEDNNFTVKAPIPYTIFGFRIENRRVTNSYCCCTKFNPVALGDRGICNSSLLGESERARTQDGMRTPTFIFPYGNTWEDFRICWGNIQLPEVNSPSDISNLINMFFNGSANGDLFRINKDIDFVNYMREVDGRAEVEFSELYPHGHDLGDFIRNLQR